MPRFFFNTNVDGHAAVDAFGLDLKDDVAAREVACRIVRRMADLPHDPSECCIYVTTESGRLAFKIPFTDYQPASQSPLGPERCVFGAREG